MARLIVHMCWHLRCTGTWWVSIRAIRLHVDEVVTLVNWSWGIGLTPWLVSINTGASIKNSAIEYKGKVTVSTTSGWRICWSCSCCWPNGKKSREWINVIRNESNGNKVWVYDDAPRFCNLSTMYWLVIVRTQLYPIIWTWFIIFYFKIKKGNTYSLSLLNIKSPGL